MNITNIIAHKTNIDEMNHVGNLRSTFIEKITPNQANVWLHEDKNNALVITDIETVTGEPQAVPGRLIAVYSNDDLSGFYWQELPLEDTTQNGGNLSATEALTQAIVALCLV